MKRYGQTKRRGWTVPNKASNRAGKKRRRQIAKREARA